MDSIPVSGNRPNLFLQIIHNEYKNKKRTQIEETQWSEAQEKAKNNIDQYRLNRQCKAAHNITPIDNTTMFTHVNIAKRRHLQKHTHTQNYYEKTGKSYTA
jgi:hypothetical protein